MTTRNKEQSSRHHKAHYKKNRALVIKKAAVRRAEFLKWYHELKMTLQCSRCSENHEACLQFHHIDASLKELSVASAIRMGWSKERVLAEMEKCVVLCANCHCKEHFKLRVLRSSDIGSPIACQVIGEGSIPSGRSTVCTDDLVV